MKKDKNSNITQDELVKAIKEAQKDPKIMKEISMFIKASTEVYDL